MTTDTIFPSSSVTTNIANLATFEINPVDGECNGNIGPGVSCAGILFSNNDGFFIFFNVLLNTAGVFGSDGETVTISQTPGDLSAVPEPTTVTFLVLGTAIAVFGLRLGTIRSYLTVER